MNNVLELVCLLFGDLMWFNTRDWLVYPLYVHS